jgi:hypothetical protein
LLDKWPDSVLNCEFFNRLLCLWTKEKECQDLVEGNLRYAASIFVDSMVRNEYLKVLFVGRCLRPISFYFLEKYLALQNNRRYC